MTHSLVIAAALLAFALTPSVGLANRLAGIFPHQTQVVRQPAPKKVVRHPVRKSVYFHTPAARTENHGPSIEQVIIDQRDWYQMRT